MFKKNPVEFRFSNLIYKMHFKTCNLPNVMHPKSEGQAVL